MKPKKNILFLFITCLVSIVLSAFLAPDPARVLHDLPGGGGADASGYASAVTQATVGVNEQIAFSDNALATIKRLNLWGNQKKINKKADHPQWKLCGIIISGTTYIALIEKGNKVKRYGAGDLLPAGETLCTVGNDFIEIVSGKIRKSLRLYE